MSYKFFKVNQVHKNKTLVVTPTFMNMYDSSLMVKGKAMYAVWDEEEQEWTTDLFRLINIVDKEVYAEKSKMEQNGQFCIAEPMLSEDTGRLKAFYEYTKKLPDNFHELNRKIIFQNETPKKEDYSTKRVPYSLCDGSIENYETIVSTLYSEDERKKFEWAIGAILTGASRTIQKFIVFMGPPGTGKSTVINIMQMLFEGYYGLFDAKSIGNPNNQFALEPFKDNPLVGIQHDGDLSGIEDNTRLNSIISHEYLNVNEKFKPIYSSKFDTFLIMGTNKPVKITDSKSGIIRRLIDIYPTGETLGYRVYSKCMKNISFELGSIAKHCIDVFNELGYNYYDDYVATRMVSATNDMYNFVEDHYDMFSNKEGIYLSEAWKLYNNWAEDANVKYKLTKRVFKEELRNYFNDFDDLKRTGNNVERNFYSNFKKDMLVPVSRKETAQELQKLDIPEWLKLAVSVSNFDYVFGKCKAQYSNSEGTPSKKWADVESELSDINTKREHYVKPPENLIVIDFDIRGADGSKSLEENLKAASKWPKTYAETSKSGAGLHLHYIYNGNVKKLCNVFDENIEIKVFTGGSSLRRKLYLCNNEPIAEISSGLPLKGEAKVVNWDGIKSERQLRTMVKKNLNKEYHAYTKPSMDYIKKLLDDAYASGLHYDISDMEQAITTFAMGSTNNRGYCVALMNDFKWKSDEPNPFEEFEEDDIIFFDVEVFPNLFVLCYKKWGKDYETQTLINPSSADIEKLCKFRLIGFNNRDYDNHILYARMMGYTEYQLYKLSKKIISGNGGKFGEAYNLSFTDIYDFCAKKQSLKKWEIQLGIHHLELGLDWDTPVPEELWSKVGEYCVNDVISTEATFEANYSDFEAREILADLANIFAPRSKSSANDTTNTLTSRIIFGDDKNPQREFIYTDLATGRQYYGGESVV